MSISRINTTYSGDIYDRPFDDYTLFRNSDGLYLGLTFDTNISERLGISSEVLWVDPANQNYFVVNTLVKYNLFNSKFNLLAGPELRIDRNMTYSGDRGTNLGFGLTGGLEFDITKRYSIYAKYNQEFNDRYDGGVAEENYEGFYHGFRLGLKFRF